VVHHDLDEFFEEDLGFPPELFFGLGGIADQEFNLGGTFIAGVVFDILLPVETGAGEGDLAELFHAVGLVGADHVVVGFILLEHHPHHLDVFLGVAPVALRVEIAEVDVVLDAGLDATDGAGDLASHEGFAAARGFVIEENAAGGVQIVGLTVVHGEPVGIHLGAAVGRARPERSFFGLGNFLHLAEHLGGRGLVVTDFFNQTGFANGFEDALRTETDDVAGVFRNIEGNAHMGLGTEVVNFVGLELIKQLHHLHGVGQIAVVKKEAHTVHMRIAVKVIDTAGIEGRGATDNTVDFVTFGEEQLGEIGTVLSGDASDQGFLHG